MVIFQGLNSTITITLQAAVDWLTMLFEAPFACTIILALQNSGHLLVIDLLFVALLYLLCQKSFEPSMRPLTEREIDILCYAWTPEPLVPDLTAEMQFEPPQLESAAGPHTKIDGMKVVNFASANYLGLIGHKRLLDSCTSAIQKYGVGSCGPRGFYGTTDLHLDCEAKIAEFLGTSDSVLYSYGLSTTFSVIPAFCKKDDIIVVDEGAHWGIQNGLTLSKSTIFYFEHNNMASLEGVLQKVTLQTKRARQIRRYIVIEAVYQNSGKMAPLDEIIKLKEKYRFRLLMDESNSFGVLGRSGRGLTEHYGIPIEKIDIVTAAMGHALAAEGGFCTGSTQIIEHQRLSSSGYVFSASLPPYLATAATSAINVLDKNPDLIKQLKENVALLWAGLSGLQELEIVSSPQAPLVFLKLRNSTGSAKNDQYLLQKIADKLLKEHQVFVAVSKRSTLDQCPLPLGIKLFPSAGHSVDDVNKVCESMKTVVPAMLKNRIYSERIDC